MTLHVKPSLSSTGDGVHFCIEDNRQPPSGIIEVLRDHGFYPTGGGYYGSGDSFLGPNCYMFDNVTWLEAIGIIALAKWQQHEEQIEVLNSVVEIASSGVIDETSNQFQRPKQFRVVPKEILAPARQAGRKRSRRRGVALWQESAHSAGEVCR